MDFSLLFLPIQFLVSFWSFDVFQLFWFGFFLVMIFYFVSRFVRSRFY